MLTRGHETLISRTSVLSHVSGKLFDLGNLTVVIIFIASIFIVGFYLFIFLSISPYNQLTCIIERLYCMIFT